MSARWRWTMTMSLCTLAALCGLLAPSASLWAQGADQPTVTLSEQALAFRGLAGESLQRTFVLAVQGQPIHNVSLALSDLVDAASGAVILSSAMVVDPASQAEIDGEQRFAVTIGGAGVRAGAYRGQLFIWYDERPAGSPLALSLEAVIESLPAVDVDVSSKNRTLAVRATDWLPYIGRPTSDTRAPLLGQVPIFLVHKTSGQATVQAATILTMSGAEGQVLPADVVRVDTALPITLADQDAQALRVVVSGQHLPAGEYNGTLLVRIRNQAAPLELPLRLQIKHGPVFPLLVLALSLLIGVWISLHNTRGLANMALMRRVQLLDRRITRPGGGLQHNERAEGAQRLEQAVDALLGGAERSGVEAQLDGVDQYVKGSEEAAARVLEQASAAMGRAHEIGVGKLVCAHLADELDDLRRQVRAGALTSLAEAQARLESKADRVEAMAQIAADVGKLPEAARQAAQERLDQAASIEEVRQIVQEMAGERTPKEPGAADLFAAAEAKGFSYALGVLRAEPGEALHETARAWNRFELKTRLGDLLGKAILYVFALLVGWTTLYLAAPTFGAKPDDYIALFLWGAAANVIGGQSINLASIWQKRRAEGEP